jgi:hypothetical protein
MNTFQDVIDNLETLAKGCYQRALLRGSARWSGGDLRGKANKWSMSYKDSRSSLLNRLNDALEPVGGEASTELRLINSRWQRVLVITGPNGYEAVL